VTSPLTSCSPCLPNSGRREPSLPLPGRPKTVAPSLACLVCPIPDDALPCLSCLPNSGRPGRPKTVAPPLACLALSDPGRRPPCLPCFSSPSHSPLPMLARLAYKNLLNNNSGINICIIYLFYCSCSVGLLLAFVRTCAHSYLRFLVICCLLGTFAAWLGCAASHNCDA
jgi:hypothetical protein